MKKKNRTFDLEDRLIDFAVIISDVAESLPRSEAGKYHSGQLIRSGTSPALVYGEAQSAESTKDFIHKIKILLKELRETRINLRIITKKNFQPAPKNLSSSLNESDELIRIFVKSNETAKKNQRGK
jgi:four helix bundle protein